MNAEIQIDLVKLAGGARLLRLSDPASHLCLEKPLDPGLPLVSQKERWLRAFRVLLAREASATGV